jgi:predicted CoA-substrate-specific enzyme activase
VFVGLDLGSVAVKAVVVDRELRVAGVGLQPTGWQPRRAAEEALRTAWAAAGVDGAELRALGVTGYGRELIPDATVRATDITCQARGVHHLLPQARTVIDIGGQDSKVISLDEAGRAIDFALNDRCAAGTGRFLEVMARALHMTVAELGEAAAASRPAAISSTCTVFAETEVVGLLARGESPGAIAAGLCQAIAAQVLNLTARLQVVYPVALVGGVAYNQGVRRALSEQLGEEVLVPSHAQFTAALGAALLAADALQAGGPG